MTESGISVVIPTRNRPDSLRRCLHSLAAQTLLPGEVIVVDSSDVFPAEEAAFPFAFRRKPSEASVCVQRNLGVQEAKGKWVLLLDDDIELVPEYLARCKAFLDAHPSEGVVTGLWTQKDDQGQWSSTYPPQSFGQLLGAFVFQHSLWGAAEQCPPPRLGQWLYHRICQYYAARPNALSKAGWPTVTAMQAPVEKAAVVSLGASLCRRDWLLQAAYDEVLDPHGIGDNYGVCVQLPPARPMNVLTDLMVWHHHSPANRLQRITGFYRRTLALHYFRKKQGRWGLAARAWFYWSLIGYLILYARRGDGKGLRATIKVFAKCFAGRNPYALAAKEGKRICIPEL